MSERNELPWRRQNETCNIEVDGVDYSVTIGLFPDGRPGEVFIAGTKVGSQMDGILDDAAILVSNCLQRGMTARRLASSMSRRAEPEDGSPSGPATVIGMALDLAAEMEDMYVKEKI